MNDRRYVAFHWALILAAPFLLLALNPNLFINNKTNAWIDPWLYTGFFLSLPDFLERWGGTYYATRLSWLLPGFALYQLFSPLVANYVLHIVFFYVLLFSVYFLVSSGINRTTAFVVTLLVGWNPEVISAMSWDYVDGAVITYFAVTLLCLEKAASSSTRRWLWAAAAGAGFTCLASANVVATTLWPICGLFLLLRVGAARWRTAVAGLGVAAIGAVAVFGFFGFANQQLGGQFLYLKPSVNYASSNLWLPSPWDVTGLGWIPNAPALILPAVAALGAMLALAGRWQVVRSFSGTVQVCLFVAVVWFVVHSTLWTHSIHISYYSSYLVPLGLLALALHPDSPLNMPEAFNMRRAIALELAILGLLVVHLFAFREGDIVWRAVAPIEGFSTAFGINAYVAFGIAALALVSLRFVRVYWFRCAAFVLALLMAYNSVPNNWATASTPRVREDFTLSVSVHEFIRQHMDHGRHFRMWYTIVAGEPRPFRNISSTYLWGYVLFNEAMPSFEPKQAELDPEAQLALLVRTQAEVDAARDALRQRGMSYSPRVQKEFGPQGSRFQVIIGVLAPITESTP